MTEELKQKLDKAKALAAAEGLEIFVRRKYAGPYTSGIKGNAIYTLLCEAEPDAGISLQQLATKLSTEGIYPNTSFRSQQAIQMFIPEFVKMGYSVGAKFGEDGNQFFWIDAE